MSKIQYTYHDRGGYRRTMFADASDPDNFGIYTEQNCDKLVEENKMLAELHPQRSTNKTVARVPVTIYEQSVREGWDENDWKRWLNDPDNAAFRVWKGRV